MKRIRVVGSSGAGKTTFSQNLSMRLGIPSLELDSIYHLEGWTVCDPNEFQNQVIDFISGESWIVDGNYSNVSDLISRRADTFIFLDFPLPLVLSRLIQRSLRRLISHEILWNNNRETWRGFFSWKKEKNVVLWMLSKHWSRRRQYLSRQFSSQFPHMNIVVLRRPRDATTFLEQLHSVK